MTSRRSYRAEKACASREGALYFEALPARLYWSMRQLSIKNALHGLPNEAKTTAKELKNAEIDEIQAISKSKSGQNRQWTCGGRY